MGGPDQATVGQLSACRRAAALACCCEQLELELIEGGAFDRAEYLLIVKELRAQMDVLGVEIAPKTMVMREREGRRLLKDSPPCET